MRTLTQGDIQVESVIPIADIQNFYMEIHGNTHTYIWMEGIIPDGEGEKSFFQPMAGTRLTVRGNHGILFEGMLKAAQVKQEGMGYHVSITGVSYTEGLDYQKKCRTFQDVSLTYEEVMQQVLADTPDVRLQFHGDDIEIGTPLYQLEETDWEFLKRLAGRLHTGITISTHAGKADIHIGIPKGQKQKADDKAVRERIWYDRKDKCFCMYVRTGDDWEIGDRIDWENREFTVIEKVCRLEQGLLYFYYTLAQKALIKADTNENPYETGIFLSAIVLDVKEEQIKVKFDVDKEQSIESAYWYPWEPDMGNLLYCMPEKGEQVYVQLEDATGNKARVVCGVHRNGAGNPEMKNSHRYFTTKDLKRMYLSPDAIGFQDMKQKKTLQAELKDDTGASLISHCNFMIMAKDNIGLKAKNILLQAPQEISLVKKAVSPTVLNMCNGFDLIGAADKVEMSGGSEDQFPVFHQKEQDKMKYVFKEPEKMASYMNGSTPVAELEGSLEYKLEGCLVKQLGRRT